MFKCCCLQYISVQRYLPQDMQEVRKLLLYTARRTSSRKSRHAMLSVYSMYWYILYHTGAQVQSYSYKYCIADELASQETDLFLHNFQMCVTRDIKEVLDGPFIILCFYTLYYIWKLSSRFSVVMTVHTYEVYGVRGG